MIKNKKFKLKIIREYLAQATDDELLSVFLECWGYDRPLEENLWEIVDVVFHHCDFSIKLNNRKEKINAC